MRWQAICAAFLLLLGVLVWRATVNGLQAVEALTDTVQVVQPPRPAHRAAACEVRSIAASSELPPTLDPALTFLRRQLLRPPFAGFRQFELLLTARLRFEEPEQVEATMLANRSLLALSYLGRTPAGVGRSPGEGRKEGPHRLGTALELGSARRPSGAECSPGANLRFRLSLKQSLAGTIFSMKSGKTLLVCCDSLPDGRQQIVSLTCGT